MDEFVRHRNIRTSEGMLTIYGEHLDVFNELTEQGKGDVAISYAKKYHNVKEARNMTKETRLVKKEDLRAIGNGIVNNPSGSQPQPVDPRLNLPKVQIGLLPLLNVLDPVKAFRYFSDYSTGNPSLASFDGVTPISTSDLTIKGVNLSSATYATLVEISSELMQDSSVDFDQYFKALHQLLVGQAYENGAISAVLTANTDLVQKVNTATASVIVTADVQAVFNSLASPVRKDAVWVVSDDKETTLQGLTLAGLPLLRYDMDNSHIPTMLGRPVLFTPVMSSTNNAMVLVDPSVIEVVPFSNGDEVLVSDEFAGEIDIVTYRLLCRYSATVKRVGSASYLALT
jgi:hypothetical protein